MNAEVNIPLLRKAVEWAEAEAAKPTGGRWLQALWFTTPENLGYAQTLRDQQGLTAECGTSYCIAGFVCHALDLDTSGGWGAAAAAALGLDYDVTSGGSDGERLFEANNTIEDVRRIAESIAGERL